MRYPFFYFINALYLYCPLVSDVVGLFGFATADGRIAHVTMLNQADGGYDKWLSVSKAAIEHEIDIFDRRILNIANMTVDIQGLDRVMNDLEGVSERSEHFLKHYIPHRLVVAKLAGRPDFEALVEKYNAYVDWGGRQRARYLGQGEKLIQYLRDEVKPLG